MESNDRQQGWVISQIERLIEMPRRDIQRACYTGAGGTGTVTPKDSTWGKRAYEVEDLALLLLINLRRSEQRGLTATAREVARDLQHSDLVDLLQAQRERIEEELERAETSLLRVRAAQAALSGTDADDQLKRLVASTMRNACLSSLTERDRGREPIDAALQTPGFDLLLDLWAGPGSFDRLIDAREQGGRRE